MELSRAEGSGPAWLPLSPGVMLYVIVPLLLFALPLALFRVTVGPQASLVVALYFWSATVMIGWLAAALGSEIVYRLAARIRPPLWLITMVGPLLSGLVLREPILEILSLTNALPGAGERASPEPMAFSLPFAQRFIGHLAPGVIVWTATNYAFDRVLGIPRYRYPAPQPAPAPAAGQSGVAAATTPLPLPPLLDRIPCADRGELIALKADDHYVRIYTEAGEALTLARLRDAIEMARPTTGMQVHRSSWVADRAVRDFRRTGHTGILYLTNGLEVPVSRSYCHQVEKHVRALNAARAAAAGNPPA